MISAVDYQRHSITTCTTAAVAITPLSADELVAVAIRCIIRGQEFPEHLRAPSAISPGLESVHQRIACIMAGPVGF